MPSSIKLAALCNKYKIQILYAFGSRAREALEVLGRGRESFSKRIFLDRLAWVDRMVVSVMSWRPNPV
jgi:hypothetical protein